jgi:hypothetical protein
VREIELWLVLAAVLGGFVGLLGIIWDRAGRNRTGRVLFVGAVIFLGAGAVFAAFHRAEGLVPLGLSAGALVVGMLWEDPRPASEYIE